MRTAPPQTSPARKPYLPPIHAQPTRPGTSTDSSTDRYEQPGDQPQSAVLDQVLGVPVSVGGRVGIEQPTRVRMPKTLDPFAEAFAVVGVGAVRIAAAVRELVMLAVIRNPGHDVALNRELAEDRERVTDTTVRLKRPVREQPVIADRDSQPRQHIADKQDRQLPNTDHPMPQQHDRDRPARPAGSIVPARLTSFRVRPATLPVLDPFRTSGSACGADATTPSTRVLADHPLGRRRIPTQQAANRSTVA